MTCERVDAEGVSNVAAAAARQLRRAQRSVRDVLPMRTAADLAAWQRCAVGRRAGLGPLTLCALWGAGITESMENAEEEEPRPPGLSALSHPPLPPDPTLLPPAWTTSSWAARAAACWRPQRMAAARCGRVRESPRQPAGALGRSGRSRPPLACLPWLAVRCATTPPKPTIHPNIPPPPRRPPCSPGELILEGGGFCGARTLAQELDLSDCDGIALRVRSDAGQTFKVGACCCGVLAAGVCVRNGGCTGKAAAAAAHTTAPLPPSCPLLPPSRRTSTHHPPACAAAQHQDGHADGEARGHVPGHL